MLKLLCRFLTLNVYLKIILVFCIFGVFFNFFSVVSDIRSGGILLRLHLGFLVLYAAQVVFILLRERMVFVLSLLQVGLAFITNADFTFVPVLRALGYMYYTVNPNMSIEALSTYKYIFMSLCVTLELLKTYLLFSLIAPAKKKVASGVPTDSVHPVA